MQSSQKTIFALLALLLVTRSATSSDETKSEVPEQPDLDIDEPGDSEVDASESYSRLARLLPWIDNQAEELSLVRSRVVLPPPPQLAKSGRIQGKPEIPDKNHGRPGKPIMIKVDQHPAPMKPGQKPVKPTPRLPPNPANGPRQPPNAGEGPRLPLKPVDIPRPDPQVKGPPVQSFRPPVGNPESIRSTSSGNPDSGLGEHPDHPRPAPIPFSYQETPQGLDFSYSEN